MAAIHGLGPLIAGLRTDRDRDRAKKEKDRGQQAPGQANRPPVPFVFVRKGVCLIARPDPIEG